LSAARLLGINDAIIMPKKRRGGHASAARRVAGCCLHRQEGRIDMANLHTRPNSNSSAGARDHASGEAAAARRGNSKQDLDRRLDLALEETFPASDPVSITICT
jgi:hypothetical protein